MNIFHIAMDSSSLQEALQRAILETLDRESTIEDSRAIRLNDEAVEQQVVLGVLKRLEVHQVLRRQ